MQQVTVTQSQTQTWTHHSTPLGWTAFQFTNKLKI